ncbi:MAG: N,N-dimethylformamidase large subunit [Woeseia sp.]|nr:N,N-dimethylformamidase large subunit [Woeseia sp.]
MLPITGYTDKLSIRPGGALEVKVSSQSALPYHVQLTRVTCADPNPAGPGWKETPIDSAINTSYPSRVQPYHLGSYMLVDAVNAPPPITPTLTLDALVYPTSPTRGIQGIIDTGPLSIFINELGYLCSELDHTTVFKLTDFGPLSERHWYRVLCSYDGTKGLLSLACTRVGTHSNHLMKQQEFQCPLTNTLPEIHKISVACLLQSKPYAFFNGKIEAPTIQSKALSFDAAKAAEPFETKTDIFARWDFSLGIQSDVTTDIGPNQLHGSLHNVPTRAVKSSAWSGQEMCWRHAPNEYAAIHFHDDDAGDFGWETDFILDIPNNFACGFYSINLTNDAGKDAIPFYVCAPRGIRKADICVIIPTFTYIVYGNYVRFDYGEAWEQRASDWNAYPHSPGAHPDYGLSTYNHHSDESGVAYSSRFRPLLNLRPGYLIFPHDMGSGLRHVQADTHLLAWLEDCGYAYDIMTDEELHLEGVASIQNYPVVLTGTHPEYHTAESWQAFSDYKDLGGRLCYLGGNGFYWRIAVHPETPGILEIRRAESGIRVWASEPGEYYNAFDGQYGGLWTRNGRPPQQLVGVGFTSQGDFVGSYYRKNADADNPRASWMFKDIQDDILGDFGLSGGGAAGFEVDRAEPRFGTPANALIVASSEGHSDFFMAVPEEMMTPLANLANAPMDELIRSDMVFFETPSGGAVFSVGSITFCGSLPHNNFKNNISTLLRNVIDRFVNPDPFDYPLA